MATVTDPIILDSTGQAIKNSIDLLSANINRTASTIPYDNNLTIKGKIEEIEDEIADVDAKTASNILYSSGVSIKSALDGKTQSIAIGSRQSITVSSNGGGVFFVYRGTTCDIYFIDTYGLVASLRESGFLTITASGNNLTITNNSGAMCLIIFIPYYLTPVTP